MESIIFTKEKEIIFIERREDRMNIKCFFGFHKWEKYMGYDNLGDGKFRQKYICKRCNKIKEVIN